MMDETEPKYRSDLDKGFNPADIQILMSYNLFAPSDVLKGVRNENLDFDDYNKILGKLIQETGRKKAVLSKTKKMRESNKDSINKLKYYKNIEIE